MPRTESETSGDPLCSLRAQSQHWTRRLAYHAFRRAAKDQMAQAFAAVSRHDDDIRLPLFGRTNDLGARVTGDRHHDLDRNPRIELFLGESPQPDEGRFFE